jgi:hypothetical protein
VHLTKSDSQDFVGENHTVNGNKSVCLRCCSKELSYCQMK